MRKSDGMIRAESLVGKRVKVISNSDRYYKEGRIGQVGTVLMACQSDCKVQFDNGTIFHIASCDLVDI